jgi:hypothetical protein
MKLFLSIPLSLLILFSGINIRYAAHFCGGNVVATKISLSGELATCGMEPKDGNNSSLMTIKSNCCEDITSEYTINNTYVPSITAIDLPGQKIIDHRFFSADHLITNGYPVIIFFIYTRPPGNINSKTDLVSVLCTFRI